MTETAPASQSVISDPQNYTLMLKPDGEVSIEADCNMVSLLIIRDATGQEVLRFD